MILNINKSLIRTLLPRYTQSRIDAVHGYFSGREPLSREVEASAVVDFYSKYAQCVPIPLSVADDWTDVDNDTLDEMYVSCDKDIGRLYMLMNQNRHYTSSGSDIVGAGRPGFPFYSSHLNALYTAPLMYSESGLRTVTDYRHIPSLCGETADTDYSAAESTRVLEFEEAIFSFLLAKTKANGLLLRTDSDGYLISELDLNKDDLAAWERHDLESISISGRARINGYFHLLGHTEEVIACI